MGLVRSITAFFSRAAGDDPRHVLGRHGERIAGQFLRGSGYKILHRNFRAKHGGEVDLVCRDGDVLAFVEVKTRTSDEAGRPADAVTQEKEALICRGARAWLRMLDRPDVVFRFDIVEVVMDGGKPRCNVIKSAFILPEERRR
jgi:putative endonuclease